MIDMKAIEADALARVNVILKKQGNKDAPTFDTAWWALVQAVTELHTVLEREAETQRRHDGKLAAMAELPDGEVARYRLRKLFEEELSALRFRAGVIETFPLGAQVRKIAGPQWDGRVVGYYSSSLTPEGLVIECTAPGALHQVHVEPAKRMEIVEADRDD